MKRFAKILIALAILAPMTVGAQTTAIPVAYIWTPPTTGSAVHHYELQQSADGSAWIDRAEKPTSPSVTISAAVGVPIQIRVRGVDSLGRSGLWSDPSAAYIPDAGAPGACGKPVRS